MEQNLVFRGQPGPRITQIIEPFNPLHDVAVAVSGAHDPCGGSVLAYARRFRPEHALPGFHISIHRAPVCQTEATTSASLIETRQSGRKWFASEGAGLVRCGHADDPGVHRP